MNKSEIYKESRIIQSYQDRFYKHFRAVDKGIQSPTEYAQHRLNWIRNHGGICLCCRNAPATSLDHIVPVSKGGLHRTWNIAYICKDCNASKSRKHPDHWLQLQTYTVQKAYDDVRATKPEGKIAVYIPKQQPKKINWFLVFMAIPLTLVIYGANTDTFKQTLRNVSQTQKTETQPVKADTSKILKSKVKVRNHK